jgi:mRNA interferase RelE/StbE
MNVILMGGVREYLYSLDSPIRTRIMKALKKLALEPPQGDIKILKGREGYRLRVGDYRLLFIITTVLDKDGNEVNQINVHAIGTHGSIYKRM